MKKFEGMLTRDANDARSDLIRYFAERTATKASAVCGHATTANEAKMPVAHHGGNMGKDGAA